MENYEEENQINDNSDSSTDIIIDINPVSDNDIDDSIDNDTDDNLDTQDNSVIRDIRKANQEKERKIKELEEKLESLSKTNEQVVTNTVPTLPNKPKLSDDDIDFDEEKFTEALHQWTLAKIKHDEHTAKQENESRKRNEEAELKNRTSTETYTKNRIGIDETVISKAEEFVNNEFSNIQRTIILQKCANAPRVVVALNANREKAKELLSIDDPIDFAFAIKELESKIKVKERPKTNPETIIDSSVKVQPQHSKARLEQLEKEAERSGDRTLLIAYKRTHNLR